MPDRVALRRLKLAPQVRPPVSGGQHQVRELRVYPLREPVSGRSYSVIRLETASGLRGYGECALVNPAELSTARQAVVGAAPTALEPIRAKLAAMPLVSGAVNMALIDLSAQIAKAPAFQVLGGPTRNTVRVLAPLTGENDDELKRSAERALKSGHKAFSVPVPETHATNHGQALVLRVKRRMEALRATTGQGTDFVLDGAARLSPGDASNLSNEFERSHLLWFDEPCSLANLGAVREVSEENVTPLGFGRSIHRSAEFQDLLREAMVDVLRPDIARNGITQIRRMATIAETYYVAVAPHHEGGPIATAAALHLAASLPNFFIQQVPLPGDAKDQAMRAELTSGSIEQVKDGYAALLMGPGLGIRVNEEALKKYAAA
jgi:galactonate dehydratase